MSGNQKQAPQSAQQSRFSQQQSNYLGRPTTPQRQEVYQVTAQSQYLQQPPNPAGNQNPLRAMGPPGPPTQASTPPAELKVVHGNQAQVNLAFMRPQHSFNYRGPAPQPQSQRMNNTPRTSQMGPMYPNPNSMFVQPCYYSNFARPSVSPYPVPNPPMNAYGYPPSGQSIVSYVSDYIRAAAAPPQIITPMPQNMPHPLPAVPHSQPPLYQQSKEKPRNNAIPIIHPLTGQEYVHNRDTAGSDSSARHSPQPAAVNAHSKEVQVAFAKGVAQSLNEDVQEEHSEISQPILQHIEPSQPTFHSNPTVHNTNRNELVQTSKLQMPKKDFVPANLNQKETPVVSAISNAEERTITSKQSKDRESPAKGRKQRPEASNPKEQIPKESVKEKEVSVEKPIKEEPKPKEVIPAPVPVVVPKDLKEKDDKKKKNEKVEVKPTKEEEVDLPIPVPEHAKPKQNSQKGGKDAQKQGGGSTKQQVTVPQSQPAKPNNKSNKIKELNMKGANKEGTDMDAFSDNIDALNANVPTATTIPEPVGVQSTPANLNANIICDSNKTSTESNETPTIKSEIKTLPKNRVDVTSIVKENTKPFVPPTPVEPKNETDRTSIANDKLVQAKNEVNAKANVDNDEAGDNKVALPYKDNQWSPFNRDGKKVYDKDFLIALRDFPMSKQKPENLINDILAQDDKARIGDVSRYGMNQRTDFAPNFGGGSNFPGKSQSHKAQSIKRTSMKGMTGGNSAKGGKSNSIIRVSISFKEDVKLHETENAWKPARFDPSANQTDEDKQTEELYKKVRGVLNKLTPQKFETLVDQIKSLPITTSDRLQGVIDLVFEKAVDEPNFSVAYALMCRELALMQVPTTAGGKDYVNFRKLIVSRCQMEFEKNSFDEGKRNERFKEIEACPDPVKKKEMMVLLDEDDRRIRMKSVGNIRFIGELFKQAMLTTGIMERCLHHLLEDRDEERLECLCKLLTTIGKELQNKKVDLTKIFDTMKEIADKKNTKVSSRVRFMLQDVIDLRSCNWVSRRQDMNPKTMDQIQKEAANEHLTIQAMNSGPITPRKDDRGSSMNSDRKRGGRNNVNEDGWSTQGSRGKNQFSFQSDKFRINKQPTEGQEILGSSQHFNIWVTGSQVKTSKNSSSNPYAALMDDGGLMDIRTNSSRNSSSKDTYNPKRPSMERQYKQYDGRGSRSGSQHRSNESSERSTPTPAQQMPTFKTPQQVQLTESELHNKIKNLLAEYVHIGDSTVKSTCEEIKNDIPHTQLEAAINEIFNIALDNTKAYRLKTGKLFSELITRKVLALETFCKLLENVFSMYEDFIVDIPNIWEYYAEILSVLVNDGVLPLTKLHKCCAFLITKRTAQKLLAPVFKLVIQEKGPSYAEEIWKESKLKLQNFMAQDAVDEFVSKNKFEFLTGSGGETFVNSNLTYPQIQEKMSNFIKQNTSFDALKKWISANLGERVKEKEFIRALMTVILENTIEKDKKDYKLNLDKFHSFSNLFALYVENNMEYELQCLHAVHALLIKLEHPKGLLLAIFSALYDENIVSQESFIKWETTSNDIEEKGVVLLQLTSFFTQLKENDEESCSD